MSKKFYGYIYVTLNQQTKKVYVGQKFGLPEETENYIGSGKYFLRAVKKYGKQFFKKIVLDVLEAESKNELAILLNEAETECIYFYRSYGSDGFNYDEIYGYNILPAGGSTLGYKHTEEWKVNASKRREGIVRGPMSEEQKQQISKTLTGRKLAPLTEEHKQKISKSHIGKMHTQETKNKISAVRKEKGIGKGENAPMYGKHHTEETKEKISKSRIGKVSPRKGCKVSQESINKRIETRKRNRELRKLEIK